MYNEVKYWQANNVSEQANIAGWQANNVSEQANIASWQANITNGKAWQRVVRKLVGAVQLIHVAVQSSVLCWTEGRVKKHAQVLVLLLIGS